MLQALVHAGGALADAMLSNQTPSHMRAAFAGKLTGAELLQRASSERPSAHTLLFSSVAALLGSAGQAGYAAANSGLDALAKHWRGSGSPVMSLQWGPWAGAGMAGRHGSTAARAAALGLGMITPAAGLAALEAVASMGADSPATIVAAQFLWQHVHSWGRGTSELGGAVKPLFAALAEETHAGGPQPGSAVKAVYALAVAALSKDTAKITAEEVVMGVLRGLLGDDVVSDQPLMEAGLDSLGTSYLLSQSAVDKPLRCEEGGRPACRQHDRRRTVAWLCQRLLSHGLCCISAVQPGPCIPAQRLLCMQSMWGQPQQHAELQGR